MTHMPSVLSPPVLSPALCPSSPLPACLSVPSPVPCSPNTALLPLPLCLLPFYPLPFCPCFAIRSACHTLTAIYVLPVPLMPLFFTLSSYTLYCPLSPLPSGICPSTVCPCPPDTCHSAPCPSSLLQTSRFCHSATCPSGLLPSPASLPPVLVLPPWCVILSSAGLACVPEDFLFTLTQPSSSVKQWQSSPSFTLIIIVYALLPQSSCSSVAILFHLLSSTLLTVAIPINSPSPP